MALKTLALVVVGVIAGLVIATVTPRDREPASNFPQVSRAPLPAADIEQRLAAIQSDIEHRFASIEVRLSELAHFVEEGRYPSGPVISTARPDALSPQRGVRANRRGAPRV